MKIVRCQNAILYSEYLVFGAEYEVLGESSDGATVTIKVASGYPVGFPRDCFDMDGTSLAFQPRTLWIAGEGGSSQDRDELDDNTDVIVTFADGSRWIASVFTYANIATLVRNHAETGECLNGGYLWATDMVLIDRLNRDRIDE